MSRLPELWNRAGCGEISLNLLDKIEVGRYFGQQHCSCVKGAVKKGGLSCQVEMEQAPAEWAQ